MKQLRRVLFIFLAGSLFLFSSCEDTEDDITNIDPCGSQGTEELVLTIQDQFTSAPARVSIFFKVEQRDGTPVAGLQSQQFTIYEKGRNDDCPRKISSLEANSAISNKNRPFTYHTMLILDLSASVTASSLAELKDGAKSFIDQVIPDPSDTDEDSPYYMGIWWFDGEDNLHELVPVSTDKAVLQAAVDDITADMSNDPSTDLYGAVIKSVNQANNILTVYEQLDIISAVSVVVFTDGTDQAGRYLKTDALAAVNDANSSVRFYSIGLGQEIDENILTQIGRNGFVYAANRSELEATFEQVAGVVWAEANSFYLFEYCSPKRDGSGINELRIEIENEGMVGSATTTFDATGFTSGCN